jgi:hypothetical protein
MQINNAYRILHSSVSHIKFESHFYWQARYSAPTLTSHLPTSGFDVGVVVD